MALELLQAVDLAVLLQLYIKKSGIWYCIPYLLLGDLLFKDLDSHEMAGLGVLSLDDVREGPVADLLYESVLYYVKNSEEGGILFILCE